MNEFLIYLSLPPYLAQWYANECNQIHNRDNATCPREVYRFPTPVVPVRGSQESDVINTRGEGGRAKRGRERNAGSDVGIQAMSVPAEN